MNDEHNVSKDSLENSQTEKLLPSGEKSAAEHVKKYRRDAAPRVASRRGKAARKRYVDALPENSEND